MTPVIPELKDTHLEMLLQKMAIESTPFFIEVSPDPNALINECFPNVSKKIQREGGSQVFGWQIWKTAYLIEAEFHAVWKSQSKGIIDITPKLFPCSQILFLEDPKQSYDGSQVANIRLNISGNSLADDLIKVCECIFYISNKGDRAYKHELKLSGEEAKMYEVLNQTKFGIFQMLNNGDTRNQKCFCGRNEKYKKCHERFVRDFGKYL